MNNCATPESEVRQAISGLLAREPGFGPDSLERLRLFGTAPPFDTHHKLTVAAASAIGAYALAVEKWWHECTGQHQVIGMDLMQAACALHPGHFQKQSGYAFPAMSLLTELKADFFRTADSRWFFPVGATPKLRDAVLDLLQCANNQEALGTSVAKWRAEDIEAEFAQRKIPGAYARSREEWLLHPQGELLSRTGAIEIEKIGDSEPEPPRAGLRPLDQLRVLDLGHIIAGPVAARTLAEHGAQVLRVSPPMRQDPFRYTIDTNIGKRSAFLDLNRDVDALQARQLMVGADVVVESWRPGSLKRRGLGAQESAALRPGIVYVSVSAFGDNGPWGTRGGYEQLGQVVSGIAVQEGGTGKPRMVPTYLLNDYLTGYLGATGAMLALLRRAREGGSYHVKVSLARTSMWVQGLGLYAQIDERARGKHFDAFLQPMLEQRQSAYGLLEQLPPVAQFSVTPAAWTLPPAPIGAHDARWLTR